MSEVKSKNALAAVLEGFPEHMSGDDLVQLVRESSTPQEQSTYRNDTSLKAISEKVATMGAFLTKLDALEIYHRLNDPSSNIQKQKASLNIADLLKDIKGASNINNLIRGSADFLMKNEANVSGLYETLHAAMAKGEFHYHFKPLIQKSSEDSDILDIFVVSSRFAPDIYSKMFEYEAALLFNEREHLEEMLKHSIRISLLYISEPMLNEIMPTLRLPINIAPLELMQSGRKMGESYPISIEKVPADRFTLTQLQEFKSSPDDLTMHSMAASIKVFSSSEADHNKALIAYRNKLNPILKRIRAHLPFTHNEFSLMVATLDDSILSEVFDRDKIIGELVLNYDNQVADIIMLSTSKLISALASEWIVAGENVKTFTILKDERY